MTGARSMFRRAAIGGLLRARRYIDDLLARISESDEGRNVPAQMSGQDYIGYWPAIADPNLTQRGQCNMSNAIQKGEEGCVLEIQKGSMGACNSADVALAGGQNFCNGLGGNLLVGHVCHSNWACQQNVAANPQADESAAASRVNEDDAA